jgi:hypothetical protein
MSFTANTFSPVHLFCPYEFAQQTKREIFFIFLYCIMDLIYNNISILTQGESTDLEPPAPQHLFSTFGYCGAHIHIVQG